LKITPFAIGGKHAFIRVYALWWLDPDDVRPKVG
jgi:hypothetical protein